jgi:hypothetical protein
MTEAVQLQGFMADGPNEKPQAEGLEAADLAG